MGIEAYMPFIAGAAVLIAVILIVWVTRLNIRMNRLLRGKDAKSLEETMAALIKDIAALKEYRKDSSDYLQSIEDRIRRSIQCVETMRFNPFKGVGEGGNQSFSTAFLNEKGEGVVISSLHIRDHLSVYAKPLKGFASEHELTDEEREVVGKAKNSVSRD